MSASFSRPVSLYAPSTWSVTHVLLAINVLAFLWEVAGGLTLGGSNQLSSWPWVNGVLAGPLLTNGHHDYWRLLTAGFLHESVLHIAMNMLSLWFVGRSLEPAIGRLYFGAIYFSSLLAGSFGALAFTPLGYNLGASGAIFGLFGALVMVARARGIPLWQSGLLPMLLFNLVFTLTVPGVSIGDHLGGLVAGLAGGWLVTEYGERRDRRAWVLVGCLVIAAASVICAIAVAGGGGLLPNGSTI